jgi:hypothetical protein
MAMTMSCSLQINKLWRGIMEKDTLFERFPDGDALRRFFENSFYEEWH